MDFIIKQILEVNEVKVWNSRVKRYTFIEKWGFGTPADMQSHHLHSEDGNSKLSQYLTWWRTLFNSACTFILTHRYSGSTFRLLP